MFFPDFQITIKFVMPIQEPDDFGDPLTIPLSPPLDQHVSLTHEKKINK